MRFLVLLFGMMVAASGPTWAEAEGPAPHPAKAFKGRQCVEPVEVMRRQHGKFLLRQRSETVRQGIRGGKYSLRQCIECHAVPDKQAAGARTVEPFCGACHQFAAAKIDCFQCHTTKPADAKVSDLAPLIAEIKRRLSERSPALAPPPR